MTTLSKSALRANLDQALAAQYKMAARLYTRMAQTKAFHAHALEKAKARGLSKAKAYALYGRVFALQAGIETRHAAFAEARERHAHLEAAIALLEMGHADLALAIYADTEEALDLCRKAREDMEFGPANAKDYAAAIVASHAAGDLPKAHIAALTLSAAAALPLSA